MSDNAVFGIFREKSHSPKREYDDEAILKETASRLSKRLGRQIPLLRPEEFLEVGLDLKPKLIFFMCEEEPCLKKLRSIQDSMDCILVNSVEAVENTFRSKMLELLSGQDFFPESTMVKTSSKVTECPPDGVWLKRGDFHAIEEEDVVFARSLEQVNEVIRRFEGRGIDNVVIQQHVPGDIIKFYSITDFHKGKEYWFKWFYHKDQELNKFSFSEEQLYDKCQLAGSLLGLEIFGGDAIVQPDGTISVIDVNAWPSFALFRQEAADAISSLLFNKTEEMADSLRSGVTNQQNRAVDIIPS